MELRQCRRCEQWRNSNEWHAVRANGQQQAWCKPCYREWHRSRYVPKNGASDAPRACAVCGIAYQPATRRPSIYCSRACKDVARNAKLAADLLASKPERECLHCAQKLRSGARIDAIFCSAKCNEKAHALQRKLRARTGQADKPGYLRAEVCERDGWWCGLCDTAVDPALEHPDPMCASLDHVVPVSRDGDNRLSNLQLTHLVCNLRRRNLDVDVYLARAST